MNKLFNLFKKIILFIYNIIDKLIVVPISRIIYRISELLKNNSGRFEKILNRPNIMIYISLFLAIIMFVLIDSKAVSLVTEEAEILSDQPVKIIYNEEAYVVEGVPETVDITLIGRKSDLYLAKQLGEHEVVLDLSGYSTGQYKVKLKYNHSIGTVNYKLDPGTVTVKISEKISAVKTLSYDLLNQDKLDSKLSIKDVELDKTEVIVKGSSDALEKVASVKALIDLEAANLTEKGTFTAESILLVAYDNLGIKIDNVEIVPTKVSVKIEVESNFIELPVRVVTQGTLTVGHAIAKLSSSVTKVRVYGDSGVLDELKYIEAPIDISGLSTDKTYSVTLKKPSGVRHMSETTTTVEVSLGTETIREFENIQVESINVGSNYTAGAASLADGAVTIIAKGTKSILDAINLDVTSIKAQVDLSGYGPGTHDIEVKVTIDDPRVTLVSKASTVKVRIVEKG